MARLANRPVVDADGTTLVTITNVEHREFDDISALRKGLPPDQCRYLGYEFTFEVPGTTAPIQLRERSGALLNPIPLEERYRGKVKIYNKLTTIVLQTGLATLDELADGTVDVENVSEKLLGLAGTQYRAKLVKVEGFHRIDVSTLTLA